MLQGKLLVTYGALVGLPLLALMSVISYGRSLKAPLSVAGPWKIAAGLSPCDCTGMVVKQSGADVVILFDDARHTTLSGDVHADRLVASGDGPRLELAVTGSGSDRRLRGNYGGKPFQAVRVKISRKET